MGEGSLHFSGFGDLNCITSKSGTTYLGFAVVLTTLCCLVEGLSQTRACPFRNVDSWCSWLEMAMVLCSGPAPSPAPS